MSVNPDVTKRPSRKKLGPLVPWRVALAVVTGLAITFGAVQAAPSAIVLYYRATGKSVDCSWLESARVMPEALTLFDNRDAIRRELTLVDHDGKLDIDEFQAPERKFWIKHAGTSMDGKTSLAYYIAEHRWMGKANPKEGVRPGDIVFDGGAHVGTFTDEALRRGAAKVIAVEPEPVNAECFRRNFAKEIAEGRVVLIEKGVWSSETTMELSVAKENSGMNSFVIDQGAGTSKISVPLTQIDTLVRELGLPRVDFIKLDIEGAEREALKGGMETLRRFRPRLMLEMYHRPDDRQVLPAIVRQAHADYGLICGPCEFDQQNREVIPHVFYMF
jgi:FkbM family methyltransferase